MASAVRTTVMDNKLLPAPKLRVVRVTPNSVAIGWETTKFPKNASLSTSLDRSRSGSKVPTTSNQNSGIVGDGFTYLVEYEDNGDWFEIDANIDEILQGEKGVEVTALEPGSTYKFRVTTIGQESSSLPSQVLEVQIPLGDAPKPEHLDVYEESPTSAVLTWKVNDKSLTMSSPKKQKHGSMNEDEFSDISWKIEVDSVGTGKWIEYEVEVEQSNKSKNQFSATVEDLEAAKSHNFRITSQNSFGSVSVSDVVSLTLSDGIPETPNVSVEKVTSTSVELKWKNILTDKTSGGKRGSKRDSQDLSAAADSNQIGYQIFHDNGSKGQQWVEADDEAEIGKNNTSIVVNGLSPNTEYKFKVVAVNTFGESAPPSKFPSAKTPSSKVAPIGKPSVGDASANTMQITWKKSKEDPSLKYRVEYNSGDRDKWVEAKDSITEAGDTNQITITKVEPGVKHRVRVVAINQHGEELPSPHADIWTIGTPKQPESPSIFWALPESVMLVWRAPAFVGAKSNSTPNDLSQIVEYSKGNANNWTKAPGAINASKSSQGYFETLISGLSPAENYFFRIVASNKQGAAPPSKTIPLKTPDGLPAHPTNLKYLEPTPTSIKVTWNCPPAKQKFSNAPKQKEEARTFLLEYDVSGKGKTWSPAPGKPAEQQKSFSQVVTGLQPGATVAFRVTSSNRFGSSSPSKLILATTIGTPETPSKPSVVVRTPTSITVKWAQPKVVGQLGSSNNKKTDDPITYKIEHDDGTKGQKWVGFGEATNKRELRITGLKQSTNYNIRVTATNKQGSSNPSKGQAIKTKDGLPPVPMTPSVESASATQVVLEWPQIPVNKNKSDDEDFAFKYQLQIDEGGKGKAWKDCTATQGPGSGQNLSATVTGLNPGTTYAFRLLASNKYGASGASSSVSTETIGVPDRPPQPSAENVTPNSLQIVWKTKKKGESDDPWSYTLERDQGTPKGEKEKQQSWTSVGSAVPQNDKDEYSVPVTGLTPGSTYDFRLTAKNKQGASQPSSILTVATDDGLPDTPAAPNGMAGPTCIVISFKVPKLGKDDEPTTYRVECDMGTKGKTWTPVADKIKEDQEELPIKSLTSNTTYAVRVVSCNKFGETPGKIFTVKTEDGLPNLAENLKFTQAEDKSIKFSFNHVLSAAAPKSQLLAEDFGALTFTIEYQKLDKQPKNTDKDGGKQEKRLTSSQQQQREKASKPKDDEWKTQKAQTETEKNDPTSYVALLSSLEPKTRYAVRLIAENKFGKTKPSDYIVIKTRGPPDTCSPPVVLKRTKDSIELKWKTKEKKIRNEDNLVTRLEYDEGSQGSKFVQVSSDVKQSGLEFQTNVKSLNAGTPYHFRVIMSNKYGSSEPSRSLVETTRNDKPSLVFTTSESVCVRWENHIFDDYNSDVKIKSYSVQYVKQSSDDEREPPHLAQWKSILVKDNSIVESTKNLSANDYIWEGVVTDLQPDTNYFIRVLGSSTNNDSLQSKLILAKTQVEGAAAQVVAPTIDNIDTSSFRVTFKNLPLDEGITYKVEIDNGSMGATWSEVSNSIERSGKKQTVNISNLDAGKTYQIRVKTINAKGTSYSRPSMVKTFTRESEIDIKLLRNLSSDQLSSMTIIEEREKWVSAHKKLSALAWIDLVLVILLLGAAIAICVVYFALPSTNPYDFSFQTASSVISVVAAIVAVVAFLLSCIRCHLCRIEREVIRFSISIIACLATLVIIIAIAIQAPPLLIAIFWLVFSVREILYFIVDRQFYRNFYTPTRKKVSNFMITVIFIIIYLAELAFSIFALVLKHQNQGTIF